MGHFDAYTVDDLREIVSTDRPRELHRQAATWSKLARLLAGRAAGLRTQTTALAASWRGLAASAHREELARARTAMRDGAEVAAGNARGWAEIAVVVEWARDEVLRVHAEWCLVRSVPPPAPDARYVPPGITVEVGEPRDLDAAREPFDRAAREVMDTAAELTTELHHRHLAVPAGYTPPSASRPPVQPVQGGTAGSQAGAEGGEDDGPFGADGPHGVPLLQSNGMVHVPGGAGPAGGPVPAGGAPMLASAPMAPATTASPRPGGTRGKSPFNAPAGVRIARARPTPKLLRPEGTDRETKPRNGPGVRLGRTGKPVGDTGHRSPADPDRIPPSIDAEIERLSRREPEPRDEDPWRPAGNPVPGVITAAGEPEPPFHDPGTVLGGR